MAGSIPESTPCVNRDSSWRAWASGCDVSRDGDAGEAKFLFMMILISLRCCAPRDRIIPDATCTLLMNAARVVAASAGS
jgi:hypothetical protein